MSNKRQAILDEVVAEVTAALPGVAVFAQRFLPSSTVPAATVYTLGDSSEIPENNRLANIRTEEVRIVFHVTGKEAHENPPPGESVTDKVNAFASAVEARFSTKRYDLNGVVLRFEYTGTELAYKQEGETVIGIGSLKYNAIYQDFFA